MILAVRFFQWDFSWRYFWAKSRCRRCLVSEIFVQRPRSYAASTPKAGVTATWNSASKSRSGPWWVPQQLLLQVIWRKPPDRKALVAWKVCFVFFFAYKAFYSVEVSCRWITASADELIGHLAQLSRFGGIRTHSTYISDISDSPRIGYVPTHNYKHSLKVNYYAAYACACVSLENHCHLQLRSANRQWCGEIWRCLEFLDDCAETEVFEVLTASKRNCSVNWISSFKLSKLKVVQRYNVAFRFLYVYIRIYIIYAHIFIRKICFCYACRSAGDFYKLLGRAGFLMDMCFLCVWWN